MSRTFEAREAKRERVPLLIGLMGASGSGKTYSALRLATGIQRETGGDVYYIDTEARRALHYADKFKFKHVPFSAPFSPLDYLEAIQYCVSNGAKTLVVDSMSHEHESVGGVLEWHDRLTTELAAQWRVSRDKAQLSAWGEPKAARRKMINSILQLGVNAIFCFRAKEKIKPPKKGEKDMQELGWMPIAGEEFVYEMTVNCLLTPGCGGAPTWQTDYPGEKAMMKLPAQFETLFARPRPLDEEHGGVMAKWAAGEAAAPTEIRPEAAAMLAAIAEATSNDSLEELTQIANGKKWAPHEKAALRVAFQGRKSAIATPVETTGLSNEAAATDPAEDFPR